MTTKTPASIQLRKLAVAIQQIEILHDVNIDILPGELVMLLGGSDAGKSTLLRAIAGLDPVSSGEIWIDDEDITRRRANKRRIALMMQSYPMWPRMTVARNVGFGLRQQGDMRATLIAQKVEEFLTLVGLQDFARHLPAQLTPGQQQRAVVARTLASGMRVNLFDEPFSAQDAQKRETLIRIVRKQQQQTGTTTLIATQDRNQAMRHADRIAVIRNGEIQQIGTPMEVYDTPASRYVAEYMGSVNLIDGEVELAGDQAMFRCDNGVVIPLFDHALKRPRTCAVMFRPHDVQPVKRSEESFDDRIRLSGRIEQIEFLGDSQRFGIDIAGRTVWMDLPRSGTRYSLHLGDQIYVGLDPSRIRILEN